MHPLKRGIPLTLGGIDIVHGKGAVGHSDGDVLSHAIVDALLGAADLGDIGTHFPSDEKQWKGVSSLEFLTRVADDVRRKGFTLENIDCTVILQEPRIRDYVDRMKEAMAHALSIDAQRISIKATTTDFLGFIGEGSGIAAVAVATLSVPVSPS